MSVLAHLTQRFATHPENLATEALEYILRSPEARQAVSRLSDVISGGRAEFHTFETQAANEDRSRPDLVGITEDGRRPLLIEVKFWAGLTAAQPNGYLDSLSEPGVVLFVAPSARIISLWDELRARASTRGSFGSEVERSETIWACVGDHRLAITSWRSLLGNIRASLAGLDRLVHDVDQLSALCDHMDKTAFLPLSSEELTGPIGRRIVQFGDLANELTDRLVSKGLADVRALRSAATNGAYGRYLRIAGHGAFLHFSAARWAKFGRSPIWLNIIGPGFQPSPAVGEALRAEAIHFEPDPREAQVPIILPHGVEKARVVDAAMEQLERIIAALPLVVATEDGGLAEPQIGLSDA